MFQDCKHVVEVKSIQLNNKGGINTTTDIDWKTGSKRGKLQLDCTSCKNGARCKSLKM
jgi:hypothetical protein